MSTTELQIDITVTLLRITSRTLNSSMGKIVDDLTARFKYAHTYYEQALKVELNALSHRQNFMSIWPKNQLFFPFGMPTES